ncbi:DUF2249 domain-containing protein [Ruania zhangjianzhongii]|uniref:DUF2249 domain-containing protein n=1 Tax=Ruania zhangjianzhongii TaxID=2603206 RepID=UPI0011C79550|nr:DUF2249 domain-containing protein [Ruania zhangjianzhongii]
MASELTDGVLDVRGMRKPDKHPTIFAAYDVLAVAESFVLVNDHDPKHLHEEFDRDYGPGYGWEYLSRELRDWRIRITKLASTPLPRQLADTGGIADDAPETGGAVFSLRMRERDLDSNVIALAPGGAIAEHWGPDVDVLIHVIAGSGRLETETGAIDLAAGGLLWLPKRSRRAFQAGSEGLRYLTVHRKREPLVLHTSRPPGAQ